jgi:integrase
MKVKLGIDPLAERQEVIAAAKLEKQAQQAAAVTFESMAENFITTKEGSWSNAKHRQQWRNSLKTYAFPLLSDMRIGDIETTHVLQVLEPIWEAKKETASRVRGRIEAILDAAKVRGYRTGENPARWRGHLAQLLPARTKLSRGHHRAAPYDDVPSILRALRSHRAIGALALEFTILTAARTGEVIGATWEEIDLQKGVWTIPAHRMKAGREHSVPLSNQTLSILHSVEKLGKAHVFPGQGNGAISSMTMLMLLKRMQTDVTVHGFRSSFRDWAAECTGYSHEVCEMALAHTIGNKAEAAYRRGNLFEKRRRLMADWAVFCAKGQGTQAKVVPIRAGSNSK